MADFTIENPGHEDFQLDWVESWAGDLQIKFTNAKSFVEKRNQARF